MSIRYSVFFDSGRWLVVADYDSGVGRREVVKNCQQDEALARRWAAWFCDDESGLHDIPPQPPR